APQHVAKGLLLQSLAELQAGLPDAPATLRRGATLAESLTAHPLIWPTRALLGALLDGSDPEEAAQCLSAARGSVMAIAGGLPDGLREEWLAQDSVGALLEA